MTTVAIRVGEMAALTWYGYTLIIAGYCVKTVVETVRELCQNRKIRTTLARYLGVRPLQ